MRGSLLLACLAVVVPTGTAQGGLLLGTEELPELPDGAGDVQYSPLYTGAKDHGYIDLTAAWFSYQDDTDQIVFTMRTAAADRVPTLSRSAYVFCQVTGNLTNEGNLVGDLRFRWIRGYDGASIVSNVSHRASTSAVSIEGREIEHGFDARFETPGYFTFTVDRTLLANLGTEIEDPVGACREQERLTAGFADNVDGADSQASYSFVEHRRTRSPEGVLDPIEEFERGKQTASSAPEAGTGADRTPHLGVSVVLGTLALGALLWRRRD